MYIYIITLISYNYNITASNASTFPQFHSFHPGISWGFMDGCIDCIASQWQDGQSQSVWAPEMTGGPVPFDLFGYLDILDGVDVLAVWQEKPQIITDCFEMFDWFDCLIFFEIG